MTTRSLKSILPPLPSEPIGLVSAPAAWVQRGAPATSATAPSKEAAPTPVTTNLEAAPVGWVSNIKLTAQLEGGDVFDPQRPIDASNVRALFTESQPGATLTAAADGTKTIDLKATGYDFDFKLQAMYGSDARYTNCLGEPKPFAAGGLNHWDEVLGYAALARCTCPSTAPPCSRGIRADVERQGRLNYGSSLSERST